jgi:hypothetical protein
VIAILGQRGSFRRRAFAWVIPKLFFVSSYLLFRSCRIRFVAKEHEDQFLVRGEPVCFAGFHQGIL